MAKYPRFTKVCNELNKILDNRPESKIDFIDTINDIIYKKVFQKGGDLYFNRQIWIECNCNEDCCRRLIHTTKVMFKPTLDPVEHPGITMCYKPEYEDSRI